MIQILAPYILLAGGLAGSLGLFLSMKREMRRNTERNRRRLDEMAQGVRHAQTPPPSEPAPDPAYAPPIPVSGLNLTKRVQAMRMVRRNEDVSTIAAALGVTRREVELLIRVQGIGCARSAGQGGSGS